MTEEQLLDVKDDRTYFVYLTNRKNPFSMFERNVADILDHMHEEISMGYTNLWVMKRIGIIHIETLSYFPDNELIVEGKTIYDKPQEQPYLTFLFAKFTPAASPIYSPHEAIVRHASFEDAAEFSAGKIKSMKEQYPDREFSVLCAKLLYDITWH
ncbi:hypothetical protein QWY14_14250 [Planococcus sp. N028]|uniref:Uncharacterized protein n=1 Tax=Planococcus shixiaomingii TaxID=3058393 RepID=A0ABT8N525_9BACL|nr:MULTISPECIES: hypothetical protein [unclassified Planococcus (in: firmicutes)]MDN7242973.1 hypothetical protein [Planococcus sp. N028]WKA55401.1 hypothetical protein QWY21_03200 [Planococcus sp. N022]